MSEILETVTALGLTTQRGRPFNRKGLQHKLWTLGFNKKGPRVEALRLIRSMVIARRSRQEILQTLRTHGPQPYEGEWTSQRLSSAIRSIQSGAWAPEILPLPADVRRVRSLPPDAIDLLINGRRAGRAFREIAHELNGHGFRTPRGKPFTFQRAYQIYEDLSPLRAGFYATRA